MAVKVSVVSSILSDGSAVFDVVISSDVSGAVSTIKLPCPDHGDAMDLADAICETSLDVERITDKSRTSHREYEFSVKTNTFGLNIGLDNGAEVLARARSVNYDIADAILAVWNKNGLPEFIVASHYQGESSWVNGHYFKDLSKAVTAFKKM